MKQVICRDGSGEPVVLVGHQKPASRIVTASKELIDTLLLMNTHNRTLKKSNVDALAGDIKEDDWFLTASGVGVSHSGVLLDGQSRCQAIKNLGYPSVQFVLVTGLDPASQTKVDRHAKRSLADALTLAGSRTVSNQVAATANAMSKITGATLRDTPFTSRGRAADAIVTRCLYDWEEEIYAINEAASGRMRVAAMAALAIYYRHAKEKAYALTSQVATGIDLEADSPALLLHRHLQSSRYKSTGGTASMLYTFSCTVSAVIAHHRGERIKLLKPSVSWRKCFKPWLADNDQENELTPSPSTLWTKFARTASAQEAT